MADPHFGDDNIVKYCKQPFSSAAHMDGALMGNYSPTRLV